MPDLLIPRRSFLTGLGLVLAAPAIVRASSLMRIAAPRMQWTRYPRAMVVSLPDVGLPSGLETGVVYLASKPDADGNYTLSIPIGDVMTTYSVNWPEWRML